MWRKQCPNASSRIRSNPLFKFLSLKKKKKNRKILKGLCCYSWFSFLCRTIAASEELSNLTGSTRWGKTRCDCFAPSESNGVRRILPLEGARRNMSASLLSVQREDFWDVFILRGSLAAECSPVYFLLGAFGDWQVSRSLSSANKPQKSHWAAAELWGRKTRDVKRHDKAKQTKKNLKSTECEK